MAINYCLYWCHFPTEVQKTSNLSTPRFLKPRRNKFSTNVLLDSGHAHLQRAGRKQIHLNSRFYLHECIKARLLIQIPRAFLTFGL